jgi:hypothetical protein
LGKRCLATGFVGQDTKLHVHIGKLRKRVVVTAESDTPQREKPLLGHGKHMRLHSANLVQLDPPILQLRIGNKLRELLVVDRQDFRNNERRRFTNFCEQILNLADPREVFVVRAVLCQLQRCIVINSFDFQLERFLELKHVGQGLCRFPHCTLPLLKFWIRPLKPGEILLPFAHVSKEMCEVPFVGFGDR